MQICEIQVGTILISNSLYGANLCQVVDHGLNEWGEYLETISPRGEFSRVSSVSGPDKLGIGWKLLNEGEARRLVQHDLWKRCGEADLDRDPIPNVD